MTGIELASSLSGPAALSAAWVWTARLLAVAVVVQSLEVLSLRRQLAVTKVWAWPLVKKDFDFLPAVGAHFFGMFLRQPNFIWLTLLQIFCALGLAVQPFSWWGVPLSFAVLLSSLRFRGLFNGGSDRMVFLIAATLAVVHVAGGGERAMQIGLVYVGVQVTLSYFMPGLAKVRSARWRSGAALGEFLATNRYQIPALGLGRSDSWLRTRAWAVIAFELLFALAWVGPGFCVALMVGGVVFHAFNFYYLGLNRFFFAWLAAYPALYFCSKGILHLSSG